jgi:hypothetical protein
VVVLAEPMLELVVEVGPDRGARFTLPATAGGQTRVGRARDNDVVLKDLAVSRHHLRLHLAHDRLIVVDHDSGNGTFKNGDELAAPVALALGDRLELGRSVLRIGQVRQPAAAVGARPRFMSERVITPMPTSREAPPPGRVASPPASSTAPSLTGMALSLSLTTMGDHLPTPASLGQEERLPGWIPLVPAPPPPPQGRRDRRPWLPFALVIAAGALVGAAVTLAILLAQ